MKLNIVAARTGALWVKLGIRTFFRQPLALAGLFFMFTMGVIVLAAVPVIGPVAAVVIVPAATLGMLVATSEAARGRFPMPSVLLSAFRAGRQRARAMLVLGGLYAAVLMAIVTLTSLLVGAEPAPAPAAAPGAAAPVQTDIRPGMLVAMALQLPLVVLFSFAPALVHWHGVPPVKSLFFSAVAFLRNLGAFVVFGLTWLLVLIGVGTLMSLVYALLGGTPSPEAMVPVALIVAAMMSTSMYFSFRDSFVPPPDDVEAPSTPTEQGPLP